MLVCPKCSRGFKTKNEYIGHMDTHATVSTRYYPCPECGLAFSNRRSFYFHMNTHDSPKDDDVTEILCDHCNVPFSTIKDIEAHLKTLPPEIRISCPFCKKSAKSFATFTAYRTHKHR